MSLETQETLDSNVYGDVASHGMPWHARSGDKYTATEDDSTNYYPGAIPLTRIREFANGHSVDVRQAAYIAPGESPDGLDDYPVTVDSRVFVVGTGKHNAGRVFYCGTADGYRATDPAELLVDQLASWCGESPGDLHYSGIGALRDGGRLYAVVSTGELFTTPQGVDYWPFITVATSVDGSLATYVGAGNTLAVCDNTLSAALGEAVANGTGSRIKHTKHSAAKLDAVSAKLMLETQADAVSQAIAALCDREVTDSQWSAIVEAYAPINDDAKSAGITRAENTRSKITEMWNTDARVTPWKGTAFGAFQALNTFGTWERGTRGDNTASERQADDLLSGKLADRESSDLELITKVLATV